MPNNRDISLRVVARFAADQGPPIKLRNTIERVVSPYGSAKLGEVLEVLRFFGWAVEPIFSLLPEGLTKKDFRTAEQAQTFYDMIAKKHLVTALPTNPVPKMYYAMDLTGPAETMYGHTVEYKLWEGVEAWRIASPNGQQTFTAMPKGYAKIKKRDRIDPSDLVKWVRTETDLPQQFKEIKNQKREVYVRTREGTGSCPCCFRNIKWEDKGREHPLMVLHGYRRPGSGTVFGQCPGVGYPPYELSPEGTIYLRDQILAPRLVSLRAYHKDAEGDTIDSVPTYGHKTVTRDEVSPREWERFRLSLVEDLERTIARVDHTLTRVKQLVTDWKLSPLPESGTDMPASKQVELYL